MSHVAILHPQCVRVGGAIQMALRTAQVLQKQGHSVTFYTFERDNACFPDLQKGLTIKVWPPNGPSEEKNTQNKLINIVSLAWHLRHVDTIIANNPPMQIVAALVKIFVPRIQTIWWHHHVPWYITTGWIQKRLLDPLFWKGILERFFIIPNIDIHIATSHFVAGKIQEYCKREAVVIHPVVDIAPVVSKNPQSNIYTLFTHGRLEPGKGVDMLVRVWQELKKTRNDVGLILFGTGSLESELRAQGIDVRPFDREHTFVDLLSGQYGHIIGVYCSSIDAFGMASLESQMAGISTLILDRGGARETMLSSDDDVPVSYLVQGESELLATISYYMMHKNFPKPLSNVNFYYKKDDFSLERLSSDIRSVINKTDL